MALSLDSPAAGRGARHAGRGAGLRRGAVHRPAGAVSVPHGPWPRGRARRAVAARGPRRVARSRQLDEGTGHGRRRRDGGRLRARADRQVAPLFLRRALGARDGAGRPARRPREDRRRRRRREGLDRRPRRRRARHRLPAREASRRSRCRASTRSSWSRRCSRHDVVWIGAGSPRHVAALDARPTSCGCPARAYVDLVSEN